MFHFYLLCFLEIKVRSSSIHLTIHRNRNFNQRRTNFLLSLYASMYFFSVFININLNKIQVIKCSISGVEFLDFGLVDF